MQGYAFVIFRNHSLYQCFYIEVSVTMVKFRCCQIGQKCRSYVKFNAYFANFVMLGHPVEQQSQVRVCYVQGMFHRCHNWAIDPVGATPWSRRKRKFWRFDRRLWVSEAFLSD